MKITKAHIEAWRRASELATSPDWGLKSDEPGTVWVLDDGGAPYCRLVDCRPGGADNALFIAYARQAFPAVLDEIEKLRTAIADARAAGYAEAIEKAAKVADADENASRVTIAHHRANGHDDAAVSEERRAKGAMKIANSIRALAPATTKEPK